MERAKALGYAVALNLPLALIWLIALGTMTEGYECGRADVDCKGWKEWLGAHGWWIGLSVAAAFAVIAAHGVAARSPWIPVCVLFLAFAGSLFVLPEDLAVVMVNGVPLVGGAFFGYRGRSWRSAAVAILAAWLLFGVVTIVRDGWELGPAEDSAAGLLFGAYLAGLTYLGAWLGRRLADRQRS